MYQNLFNRDPDAGGWGYWGAQIDSGAVPKQVFILAVMNGAQDTAEYGNYLFASKCIPLLSDFMKTIDSDVIGKPLSVSDNSVDNIKLIEVNEALRNTGVEKIGKVLRGHMKEMKAII